MENAWPFDEKVEDAEVSKVATPSAKDGSESEPTNHLSHQNQPLDLTTQKSMERDTHRSEEPVSSTTLNDCGGVLWRSQICDPDVGRESSPDRELGDI